MWRLHNIWHLGIKELRSLARDPIFMILIVWAFSIGVYLAATGVSMELRNAPIAVVDEDQSELSQRIVNAFYGPYFRKPDLIALDRIDRGMDSGRYTFVLDIPPGFNADVLAGRQPAMQLNVDATQMSHAFIGAGYINSIVNGEIEEYLRRYRSVTPLPVDLVTRMQFNPNLTSSWFASVMEIINNITMLSMVLAGAALIREREHGTIEHLLVMPLTRREIMLAKIWANGLVVLVAAALSLYLVVKGALGVPIAGSLSLFLFGTAIYLFSVHVAGHPARDGGALDAAIRAVADPGSAAAADPLGRLHAARKHAGDRSEHHAVRADHALRQLCAGYPLSRRGAGDRLAATSRHRRDRSVLLWRRIGALP